MWFFGEQLYVTAAVFFWGGRLKKVLQITLLLQHEFFSLVIARHHETNDGFHSHGVDLPSHATVEWMVVEGDVGAEHAGAQARKGGYVDGVRFIGCGL